MTPAPVRPPLVRSSDRVIAGVCAGLANHLGWPVRMVRIGMVVAALAGGAGVAFYAWLWIMVPTADVMHQSKHGSGFPGRVWGPNRGSLRDRSGCSPVEPGAGNGKDRSMNPQTPHPDESPASADRPATDQPDTDRPGTESSSTGLPGTERSATERPGTGVPGAGQPAAAPAGSEPAAARPVSSEPIGSGSAGEPPPEPPRLYPPGSPYGPLPGRAPQNFFDWIRSQGIYRGRDRWVGGVASGIAHRLGVDPLIIRGVLIVLTIFAGIGVLAYGLAWT